MNTEYLPSNAGNGPDIVLLHGWANNREIWRPLLARLRAWSNVTLIDVPGLAPGVPAPASLDALLPEILDCCPEKSILVGWSLGGQIATKLALAYPERFVALVTIASNPRFIADDQWPGMAPDTFAAFREGVEAAPAATLRRFDNLQASGSAQKRLLMRQVAATRPCDLAALPAAGLNWLAELDTLPALSSLAIPQLHLLAGSDALVPAALASALQHSLRVHRNASIEVLPACSHLLPLEQPQALAQHLQQACNAWGLSNTTPALPPPLDKRDIAASFSRAATGYDSMARLQRDVGEALLARASWPVDDVRDVLDLGCGTGYFCPRLRQRYPQASYTGLDIAEGMVNYARGHYPDESRWTVADAESLPLAAQSMDFVFSSLAIQWCLSPTALLAELARVLRPGGRCVFTTLGPATLHELRTAWAAVDSHQHVNEFLPAATLEQAATRIPGVKLTLVSQAFRMDYASVRDLLLELKTIGAHNVNQRRPSGLTSPATLRGMMAAYEEFRVDGRLPASYDVIFGELEKV